MTTAWERAEANDLLGEAIETNRLIAEELLPEIKKTNQLIGRLLDRIDVAFSPTGPAGQLGTVLAQIATATQASADVVAWSVRTLPTATSNPPNADSS